MSATFSSPLSTKESRDRLARKPIHPEDTPPVNRTIRSPPTKSSDVCSPPNSAFIMSSPVESGERLRRGGRVKPANDTPGVSVIVNNSRNKSRNRSTSSDETLGSDEENQPSAEITSGSTASRRNLTRSLNDSATPARKTKSLRNRVISGSKDEIRLEGYAPIGDSGILTGLKGFGLAGFVVLMIWVAIFYADEGRNLLFIEHRSLPQKNWNKSVEDFRSELRELKETFPNQETNLWTAISASLRKIMTDDPQQPAILLFTHQGNAKNEVECLAQKVGKIGSSALRERKLHITPLLSTTIGSKNDLHDKLEKSLSMFSTSILFDLEKLPGDAAMSLHAFCDNINAPHKHAVLTFTLELDDQQVGKFSSYDSAAESILSNAWKSHLSEDKISPIVSRVAVNVINVVPEMDFKQC